MALPRGLKNNNPGNLEKGGDVFIGELPISSDPRFKQFETIEYGYRAMIKNLQTYISKYGKNTIEKMITKWAPPTENDTAAYIATVSKKSGISPSKTITTSDYESLAKIVAAMSYVENGVEADWSKVTGALKIMGITNVIIDQAKKKSGG